MSELTNEAWRDEALDSWQRMMEMENGADVLFKSFITPVRTLGDDAARTDIFLPHASLRLVFPLSGDDKIFWEEGDKYGSEAMTPENVCSRYLWILGLALKENRKA